MKMPVHYTADATAALASLQQTIPHSRVAVLFDETVYHYHYTHLAPAFGAEATFYRLPSGENHKTLESCSHFWQHLYDYNYDRKALILAIGGGVATDLAAFAASCWLRGVRFVLVPTTLLAMVDASTGGKTGVDFAGGKNIIGTFAEPEAVVIAPQFLATLPYRQLHSGYAEALKHGLIADADYWYDLTSLPLHSRLTAGTATPEAFMDVIRTSLAIKTAIVAADPRESGERKLLNFGHTAGHAVESLLLATDAPLLHGEAVALGMAAEVRLSVQYAGLSSAQAESIISALQEQGYPCHAPQLAAQSEALRYFLARDKKNETASAQPLRLSLLREIGRGVYDVPVPVQAVIEAIIVG